MFHFAHRDAIEYLEAEEIVGAGISSSTPSAPVAAG